MVPNPYEDILKSLLGFYDRYDAEVLGHEDEPPDPETLARIECFVSGEMPESDWNDFFAQVANRPKCMALIAEKLQALTQ